MSGREWLVFNGISGNANEWMLVLKEQVVMSGIVPWSARSYSCLDRLQQLAKLSTAKLFKLKRLQEYFYTFNKFYIYYNCVVLGEDN